MNTYFAFNVICAIVAIGACMYAALKNSEAKEAQDAAEYFEAAKNKLKADIEDRDRKILALKHELGKQISDLESKLREANEELAKMPKPRKRDEKGRDIKA